MGKKLDALLRRSFKTSKFRSLVNLALSRLAVLKNQRQTRFSLARSDVLQLLNLGHHDRALLRVEQVIKEQNMLDVFSMIEGYSLLLTERVKLIEHDNKSLSLNLDLELKPLPSRLVELSLKRKREDKNMLTLVVFVSCCEIRECPEELKEAISSLIFAASRCGEFPELQEIRALFTSRYGKEFTSRAVELRNNCGVNPKMIQKLSTRQPSLEARMKVLQDIANENSIILELEELEVPNITPKENTNGAKGNQEVINRSFSSNSGDVSNDFPEEIAQVEGVASSMNRRRQYKDATDAAQEAFLSAAYAAAAARAAVELSKSSPRAPDDRNSRAKQVLHSNYDVNIGPRKGEYSGWETEDSLIEHHDVNPLDTYSLNSAEKETKEGTQSPEIRHTKQVDPIMKSTVTSPEEVVFDESHEEARSERLNSINDEDPGEKRQTPVPYFSQKQAHSSFQDGSRTYHSSHSSVGLAVKSPVRLNSGKPISVRTRR